MTSSKPKRGRPALGNDPLAVTALQANLLAQAAGAGVPVDPEAVDAVAQALVRFAAKDVQAVDILKDSPLALEAMARLAVENPDAFLRHYAAFLEFSKPKLARVEHKHDGANLGVFVAVEHREAGPPARLADKVIEGK
jgi:hypothetical protein